MSNRQAEDVTSDVAAVVDGTDEPERRDGPAPRGAKDMSDLEGRRAMAGGQDVSEPGSVTIGVAVPIPEPLASEVLSARRAVSGGAPTNIPTHVTLVPPTVVPAEELSAIEDHVRAVAADEAAFEVHLCGTGTFQPVSDVVFLHLASGRDSCDALQRLLRTGPLERDLTFPYHPHVTLAHNVDQAGLDEVVQRMAHVDHRFLVDRVVLYVDESTDEWRPVAEFPLATAHE